MYKFPMAFSKPLRLMKSGYLMRNSTSFEEKITTAGILVIGDEILKGEVVDTNSSYVAKTFHDLGIKVQKICVVADEIDEISNEIAVFSKKYTYVLSTGGIGSTHDDVTFEAVAKAFDVPLLLHPHLVKLVQRFYKTSDPDHAAMKLARVPVGSRLFFSNEENYPNVSVENVYIFPGVPELFQRSFNILAPKLFKGRSHFHTASIYVNVAEHQISHLLNKVANECPYVQIGSYPRLDQTVYSVKITLESTNEEALRDAKKRLLRELPMEFIVTIE